MVSAHNVTELAPLLPGVLTGQAPPFPFGELRPEPRYQAPPMPFHPGRPSQSLGAKGRSFMLW